MLYSLLVNTLGPSKYPYRSDSNSYTFNCPKCTEENYGIPDNKFNLGVLLTNNKHVCHCWKCSLKSSVKNLLKKYSLDDYKTYCDFNYDTIKIEDKPKSFFVPRLPYEFIPFNKFDLKNEAHYKAYDYIVNERKISNYIIKKLNIGACFEGHYKDRIIIPSYDKDHNIVTFIGRTFYDNVLPTYNGPSLDKDTYVFNDSEINWNHPIFLVEGPIDMTSMYINTIPLLGKILTHKILEKIMLFKPPVYIILDEGEEKVADDMMYKIELYGLDNVNILKVKNKDLNEIYTKQGQEFIVKDVLGYEC